MEIKEPEQVGVSDITYVGCRNRHMYLALITDAYSKKIVGYDLSSSLDTSGALRPIGQKIVHHFGHSLGSWSLVMHNIVPLSVRDHLHRFVTFSPIAHGYFIHSTSSGREQCGVLAKKGDLRSVAQLRFSRHPSLPQPPLLYNGSGSPFYSTPKCRATEDRTRSDLSITPSISHDFTISIV